MTMMSLTLIVAVTLIPIDMLQPVRFILNDMASFFWIDYISYTKLQYDSLTFSKHSRIYIIYNMYLKQNNTFDVQIKPMLYNIIYDSITMIF